MSRHSAHAVLLCTGGYGNVFFLSTNAKYSNASASWRAHRRGALFANPCYTQIHPTCIPASDEFQSKLTLMSESLRNDGRIWVPKDPDDARSPDQIPEDERDYFLERKYPSFGNLVPARRRVPQRQDDGRRGQGRRPAQERRVPRLRRRHQPGRRRARSTSATATSSRCTSASPTRTRYKVPMRIYPAVHYTMGGLWVDYHLMSNVPGLFVLGEANFSDHGANRLGASALMQGLADGYFVISYTLANYLADLLGTAPVPVDDPVVRRGPAVGRRPGEAVPVDRRHPLGRPLPPRARQDHVGLLRHGPQQSRASRRRSRRSPRCARSSGRTSGCSATAP